MTLAVRKEPTSVPGGGFHYALHPIAVESGAQAAVFELMGYIIIEVDEAVGERLLRHAISALEHQIEVAVLAEKAIVAR